MRECGEGISQQENRDSGRRSGEDERRDDAKGRTRDKKMKKETAEKEKADPPEQKLKCYYVMLTQAIHCVQLINDEDEEEAAAKESGSEERAGGEEEDT